MSPDRSIEIVDGKACLKGKITPQERNSRGRLTPINEILSVMYRQYENLLDQAEEMKIGASITFHFVMTAEVPEDFMVNIQDSKIET